MSEFSFSDICRWMGIAYDRDCPVSKAIYYDLFFDCQKDQSKFMRATRYFEEYLKDKLSWIRPANEVPK